MGSEWLLIPLLVAGFGALVVLAGLVHLLSGRPGRAGRNLFMGLIVGGLGLVASLIALNTQTYGRLTHEKPVALVTVKAEDPADNRYSVTVKRIDGVEQTRVCSVQGDEWLIAARVQTWKPWANVLGLDTTYELDQIANKYTTAERGNGKTITACDLRTTPEVNRYVPPHILSWLLDRSFTENRRFGSANYMPLTDGAEYRVVITQTGLNSEPVKAGERDAGDGSGAPKPAGSSPL